MVRFKGLGLRVQRPNNGVVGFWVVEIVGKYLIVKHLDPYSRRFQ